jgi:hypothetical protein
MQYLRVELDLYQPINIDPFRRCYFAKDKVSFFLSCLILCYVCDCVCRLSFVVCRLSFVVCRLSFVVCRLSFVFVFCVFMFVFANRQSMSCVAVPCCVFGCFFLSCSFFSSCLLFCLVLVFWCLDSGLLLFFVFCFLSWKALLLKFYFCWRASAIWCLFLLCL